MSGGAGHEGRLPLSTLCEAPDSLGSLACHELTFGAPKKPGKVSLVLRGIHFLLCTCVYYQ